MKIGPFKITKANEVQEKVISFNIAAKPTEQGKGKVEQQPFHFNEDGEPHPTNFALFEKIRKRDPRIAGAITKTSNMVVGPGFYVIYPNKRVVKKCNDFIDKINFDNFLRIIVNQMLTFGNSFVEKIKLGEELVGLKILNPITMFVKRNNKGFPEKYVQRIGSMLNEVITWEPNEITHFKHNLITGDEAYGNSLIEPVSDSVNKNLNLEENMSTIIERKANAPLQVKIGSDEYPAQDEDISAWQTRLETLRNNTEWATNHVTEIKVVGFEGEMLDLKPYDEHFTKNIEHGLMVPNVLMGGGTGNEGMGNTQMKDFILHAKSIQKEIEKYLEEDIFFELTSVRINWMWGEFTVDDMYKQLDVFSRVLGNDLSPDVRASIETRILRLLGKFDKEITAEEIEKRKEEERQKMMEQASMGGGFGKKPSPTDNGANRDKQTNRNPQGTEKRPLSKKEQMILDVYRNEVISDE